MEKAKKKTVFSTALPYSETRWPPISTDIADSILRLLVPLLKPVGAHTREHVPKGKRGGKQKNSKSRKVGDPAPPSTLQPALSSYLKVGFNSTIRMLEELAGTSAGSKIATTQNEAAEKTGKSSGYSVLVFVCRSALPEPVCQSIPVLVATASMRSRDVEPIPLVELSANAEAAVSAALALPRVSALAVHQEAPGMGPLLRLIREHIEPVEIPWLSEVPAPIYLPTKVKAMEAAIGVKKSSCRKRKAELG